MSQQITNTRVVILAKPCCGKPTKELLNIQAKPLPALNEGHLLLKLRYVSIDPGLRLLMTGEKGHFAEPFEPGTAIKGPIICEVIQSKSSRFKEGELVGCIGDWAECQVKHENHVRKQWEGIDPEAAISIVGINGLAAYFGLIRVGKLKEKNTVVITGAAGATGYIAGCIVKLMGCRVIGIVGSREKEKFVKSLGFDEAINYKEERDIAARICRACPDGVDLFFDTVGGEIADAVHKCMRFKGHIVQVGAISQYNLPAEAAEKNVGARQELLILNKRLRWKGFVVQDYHPQFDKALQQLATWYKEKKIPKKIHLLKGFDAIPDAFINVFEGLNIGKTVVEC